MEGSGEKLFSEYPLDSQRGSGAVAGGGTSFFLSRSIAFTRVASRTPGEGSFLGRKQLGRRRGRRLTCLRVTMSQRRQLRSLTQKLENLELTQDGKSSPASLEMHRSLVAFLTNASISHQAGGCTSYFPSCLPPRLQARAAFLKRTSY